MNETNASLREKTEQQKDSFCVKHGTYPKPDEPCWQCIVEHIPAYRLAAEKEASEPNTRRGQMALIDDFAKTFRLRVRMESDLPKTVVENLVRYACESLADEASSPSSSTVMSKEKKKENLEE